MAFHNCQHPKRVYNKYLDRYLFVDCRECPSCRARRSMDWTARLNNERSVHRYCLFGTLTYNDSHLPKVEISKEVYNDLDDDSRRFIDVNNGFLPVGSKEDVQKFLKRVRERVRSNPSGERGDVRYVRYFVVNEFGETTFRPHYHFLFFFSSEWLAENYKDVISESWKSASSDVRNSKKEYLGFTDVQHVTRSASSYVASYINCYTSLPEVYRRREFRPFYLSSRSPSIGSLPKGDEETKALFDSGSVEVSGTDARTKRSVLRPIPQVVYNRLYPKLKGFSEISDDVFRRLLRYYLDECFGYDFDTVRRCFEWRRMTVDDGLSDYLNYILSSDTEKMSASRDLFCKCNRIIHQSRIFLIDTDEYVSRIRRFYSNLDMYRLRNQLTWEQKVSVTSPPNHLLSVDLEYMHQLSSDMKFCGSQLSVLKSYGYDEKENSVSDLINFDLTDISDVSASFSKANAIVLNNKRKHLKNEYLYSSDCVQSEDFKQFCIDFHNKKCNGI